MRITTFIRTGGLLALLTFKALAGAATVQPEPPATLFSALRNGDAGAVHRLATSKTAVNTPNASGETPLMYAALYANVEEMKLLLNQGADPNAKTPAGTTALMLATGDLDKVRLLIRKGADVNAHSVTGRTPLLIAASRTGAGDVVKLLLARGASPNVKDTIEGMPVLPAGSGGSTPLIEAAKIRDGKALDYLLKAGAGVNAKDNAGADALSAATLNGNLDNVRQLLANGAHVDSRVTVNQFTPLIFAAWRQMPQLAKLLIDAGADPNAQDVNGSSALMWSAYSDYGDPETTRVLLEAGAKLDVRNKAGDTAMAWARRRGDTAIVRLLGSKGAQDEPAARLIPAVVAVPPAREQSVPKALALLQQSGPKFFKVSGCISCHNESVPQMATAMARQHGIPVNEGLAAQTQKQVSSILKGARMVLLEMTDVVPDMPGTAPYVLLGMAAEGYTPDEYTDATILNLAAKQFPDGSWRPWAPRPPLEFSAVTSTSLAIRALQAYAPPALRAEFEQRIVAARAFLRTANPHTNEEKAMRLLGLEAAHASQSEIAAAAVVLASSQRPDGGWSQLDTLESDAYATGQALYALRTSGGMTASDPVFTRGADYLLRTQQSDGSWHVISRAFAFQPYHESGFPHGKDQWISAAGTGWATLALMLGAEPAVIAHR